MADGSGGIVPPFINITDETLSAGKPWTQTLSRTIRDDIEHVHELIHDTLNGHNHNGVNSALISAAASFILPLNTVTKSSSAPLNVWTTVSIAGDTGAQTAKIAVLRVHLAVSGVQQASIEFRATGTSPVQPRDVFIPAMGSSSDSKLVQRTVFVPLDASERYDFRLQGSITGVQVDLEGWIV